MTIKLLLDMNLSPRWVQVLANEGWVADHWAEIGDPKATDQELMQWARENERIVFTHDLDFGTLLAISGETGPSVVLLRSQEVLPSQISNQVISTIRAYQAALESGALIVIDERASRVRILPLRQN